MRLTHELVHLRMRGKMDDDVDQRILDTADPTSECWVMPSEVL
jgi:hypothetical protein